jgi:hypothetical protein
MAIVTIEVHGEDTKRYLGRLRAELWPRAFKEAGKEIGREALLKFRQTVSTWDHKPAFEEIIDVGADEVTVLVGTDDKIYGYLDRGTGLYGPRGAKYPIVPKQPGYPLKFMSGYQAKTVSAAAVGARGGSSFVGARAGGPFGEVVRAQAVMHPGVKPRDFTGMIQRYMNTKAHDIIERKVGALLKKRYI